jgi:hypothetical protein
VPTGGACGNASLGRRRLLVSVVVEVRAVLGSGSALGESLHRCRPLSANRHSWPSIIPTVATWQLILAFVSPVSGLIVAFGALFWGRQVVEAKDAQIEAKDAQIEGLKQMSAAEVLPQIKAMKELHQIELEQERGKLKALQGDERKRLEADIDDLESQLDALTKVGEAWPEGLKRLNLSGISAGRGGASGTLTTSRLVGPPNT